MSALINLKWYYISCYTVKHSKTGEWLQIRFIRGEDAFGILYNDMAQLFVAKADFSQDRYEAVHQKREFVSVNFA